MLCTVLASCVAMHADRASDSSLVLKEDWAGHTVAGNLGNIDGECAFHEKDQSTVKFSVSI